MAALLVPSAPRNQRSVASSFQRYGGAPASQNAIRSSIAASTPSSAARACASSPRLSGGRGGRRSAPDIRNQVRQAPAPASSWPAPALDGVDAHEPRAARPTAATTTLAAPAARAARRVSRVVVSRCVIASPLAVSPAGRPLALSEAGYRPVHALSLMPER